MTALNEDAILVDMFLPRKRTDILTNIQLETSFIPGKFLQGVTLRGNAMMLAEDLEDLVERENIQISLLQQYGVGGVSIYLHLDSYIERVVI